MKSPVPGMGYICLSFGPKGLHGNPQTAQAIAKAIGCFLQIDGKAPWLKTTPTYMVEHGKIELVPN